MQKAEKSLADRMPPEKREQITQQLETIRNDSITRMSDMVTIAEEFMKKWRRKGD